MSQALADKPPTETNAPESEETEPSAKSDQPDEIDTHQRQALAALNGMMPGIVQLADQSGQGNIQFHVTRLRNAAAKALGPDAEEQAPAVIDTPDLQEILRNQRLVKWGNEHGYVGNNAFHVQGSMIRKTLRPVMSEIEAMIAIMSIPDSLTKKDFGDTAYRIIKGAAKIFDPERDGNDFVEFVKPMVIAGARRCIAAGSQVIPERTYSELLFELAGEDIPPTNTQTTSEVASAEIKQPNTPRTPSDPPPVEAAPTEKSGAGNANTSRSERNARLIEWGNAHSFRGSIPFDVQGNMIRAHIARMVIISKELASRTTDLSQKDLQNAGYNILKGLVNLFDPAINGNDFWVFAEPYVRRAMEYCIAEGEMNIPDRPNPEFIEELPTQSAIEPEPSPVSAATPVETEHDSTAQEPIASLAETPPPSITTVVEVDIPQTAPEPDPPPANDPPPPEPEPVDTRTPEEKLEAKRKRRFCRWADEHDDISVVTDDFEQAVKAICAKYKSLANSAANRTKGVDGFRGGKPELRRKAVALLPAIVRDFDPPTQATEKPVHFPQFVQTRLEPQLLAIVDGRGRG